jgi:cytochrome c
MRKLALASLLCFAVVAVLAVAGQAADAKALYGRCAGCHGADGSKQALGTGKPLKGVSAEEATKALRGYKAKTFGGEKKAIMEAQCASLSDEDIKALAQYIAAF